MATERIHARVIVKMNFPDKEEPTLSARETCGLNAKQAIAKIQAAPSCTSRDISPRKRIHR